MRQREAFVRARTSTHPLRTRQILALKGLLYALRIDERMSVVRGARDARGPMNSTVAAPQFPARLGEPGRPVRDELAGVQIDQSADWTHLRQLVRAGRNLKPQTCGIGLPAGLHPQALGDWFVAHVRVFGSLFAVISAGRSSDASTGSVWA